MKTSKRTVVGLAAALFLAAARAHAYQPYTDLYLGYYAGMSLMGMVGVDNLIKDFPLGIEAGIGYSFVDGGDPLLARRVFIDNNTNGSPEESSRVLDFDLNLTYPIKQKTGSYKWLAFVGPRHARFRANFLYRGANEEFDVQSKPWGFGGGVKGQFPINNKLSVVTFLSVDFYSYAEIEGHDSFYRPNDQNLNPQGNYKYADARDAVNVPRIRPRFMVGIQF